MAYAGGYEDIKVATVFKDTVLKGAVHGTFQASYRENGERGRFQQGIPLFLLNDLCWRMNDESL